MAWGSPKVTRLRRQADQTISYTAGTNTLSLQHVGMLESLLFRYNATYAYTKSVGGSTQDAQGPFNSVSNLNVKVNGIGQFLDCSAWMLYLYDLVHYPGFDPASSDNPNVLQTTTGTSIFSFPAVPGASGNVTLLYQLRFPFVVKIANIKEVGLFIAQNDEVNLQVTPSFNGTAMSATKLAAPYDLAGGDSMTIGTPTLDLVRSFYAVPANKGDYPIIGWFHQIESQRVSMTATTTEIAHPKGGVILRAIYQCIDGGTPGLMANSTISKLQWVYGSNETPWDESITDVLLRQRVDYGHDLPQGALVHDFFGEGGNTMRHTYDTQEYQNLRTRIVTASTPAAGSYVDVIRERLIPIGTTAESLY